MDLADLQTPFGLGDNEVRPAENRVLRGGVAHNLEPKSMAVLLELARRTGETVSRDDLISAVWPRGYVTDGVLSRCISQLRGALGDDSKSPLHIATVPRKGIACFCSRCKSAPQRRVTGFWCCPSRRWLRMATTVTWPTASLSSSSPDWPLRWNSASCPELPR